MLRRWFGRRLLFKIALPYFFLVLLVGIALVFLAGRLASLERRLFLERRLTENARQVLTRWREFEATTVDWAREATFIDGLQEALLNRDLQGLRNRLVPFLLEKEVDWFALATPKGPVLSFRIFVGGDRLEVRPVPPPRQLDPLVDKVLSAPRSLPPEMGSQFLLWNGDPYLVVGAPIYNRTGERAVAALLLGRRLTPFLDRMAGEQGLSLSLYNPAGEALYSTLPSPPPPAPPSWANRTRELKAQGIQEYLVPWDLQDEPVGLLGVGLSTLSLGSVNRWLRLGLGLVLFLGTVGALGVGAWATRKITGRVAVLVEASREVGRGNYEVQIPPLGEDELGVLGQSFNEMIRGLRDRERIREAFGRYVSPEVAEAVLRGEVELGGERRRATMLFLDIRDFTTLSEAQPPEGVVRTLNEFFTEVVGVARRFGGLVNKFGGDSSLIVFGVPLSQEDASLRAVETALAIEEALQALNERRQARGEPPLRIGIGIHAGDVVAGNVGSPERLEYTVIGDPVNVAARLQGLRYRYPEHTIFVSEAVLEEIGPFRKEYRLQDLGKVRVKGKQAAIHAYVLLGRRDG